MERITPRWLTHLLQRTPVEAGIYRLNRVKDESKVTVDCSDRDERVLPQTFVDYEEHPREYMLSAVNTVVDIHTRSTACAKVRNPLTMLLIRNKISCSLITNPGPFSSRRARKARDSVQSRLPPQTLCRRLRNRAPSLRHSRFPAWNSTAIP